MRGKECVVSFLLVGTLDFHGILKGLSSSCQLLYFQTHLYLISVIVASFLSHNAFIPFPMAVFLAPSHVYVLNLDFSWDVDVIRLLLPRSSLKYLQTCSLSTEKSKPFLPLFIHTELMSNQHIWC